jgi:hypothetical protein
VKPRSLFWGLLLIVAVLAGCNRYVGRAKRAYNDGRYLEASEHLDGREAEVYDLPPRLRADYGIYRGLSLMMLGDLNGAHQWLSFAYEVEQKNPGTLSAAARASWSLPAAPSWCQARPRRPWIPRTARPRPRRPSAARAGPPSLRARRRFV